MVVAQTTKPTLPSAAVTGPAPSPAHLPAHHAAPAASGPGMGGLETQGKGKGMSHGMMGGMGSMGMMAGVCPMMGAAEAKVEVKKLAKGVTITVTSDDPRTISRVQKMGEAMRLMHEAASE